MDKSDRIQQLHRILKERRTPITTQELAERLECSEKTIERNLATLRDLHNAPLIRKPRQGWQYNNTGETFELPGTWFTSEELIGLSHIFSILKQMDSELLNQELEPVNQQIKSLLEKRKISYQSFNEKIKIIPLLKQTINSHHFNTISQALINQQTLEIIYQDYKGNKTQRTISPQRLIHYQENWYIDSYCHLRKSLRSFKLSRIVDAQINKQPALKQDQAKLDEHFSSAYGIFSGKAKHTAKLVFYNDVAREVAQQQWHPQQQGQWQNNEYHLSIPYSNDKELIRDILKYANNVEVLSPATLRKKIINIHNASLHLYTNNRTRI